MHKVIKRFGLEGKIGDDADFARLRAQYENMTVKEMREAGYIPVLDLGPYFSTLFDKDSGEYEFKLSIYGVYIGRRRSWEVEGVSNGREIMKPTPPTKLQRPSGHAE